MKINSNLVRWLSGEAMDESLEQHDATYHGGHFDPETMSCGKRDKMEKADDPKIKSGVSAHAPVKEDEPKAGQKKFFHPSVTADIIPVRKNPHTGNYEVLLIKRSDTAKAYPGSWAVPGGFIDEDDQSAAHAAARELKEETGISNPKLKFIGGWNKKGRDPRGPVFSHAYIAMLPYDQTEAQTKAGDDAKQTSWLPISIDSNGGQHTVRLGDDATGTSFSCSSREDEFGQPEFDMGDNNLAFDHANILAHALIGNRDMFR